MSKRNNESTQQNRRIVRWSRRHVQSRRNVREDGDPLSDIWELSKTRQSPTKKFGRSVGSRTFYASIIVKTDQMWVVLFFQTVITVWDIRTSMDLWLRWKLTLKSTSSTQRSKHVYSVRRVDKGSVVLFRQRMQQMLHQGLLLIRFLHCPECQLVSSVRLIASQIQLHRIASRPHDRHLTEDESSEKDVHGRRHTGRQPYRSVIPGVISSDPYTHLMKECGSSATKRLLKRPGTTMLVGSGPFKCDSCDEVHVGDVDVGKSVRDCVTIWRPMTMIHKISSKHKANGRVM
jgi:hypothetical protein